MEVVLKDLYKQVSAKLGIPASKVGEIYNLYWKQIKDYIEGLPLKNIDTIEGVKTNVHLHHIGKLWCEPRDYNRLRNYYGKNETEEDKTDIQQDSCDS